MPIIGVGMGTVMVSMGDCWNWEEAGGSQAGCQMRAKELEGQLDDQLLLQ